MSATVKQTKTGFEECHMALGVRPEKGHLALEVKMASETVCDQVWDKLLPTPPPNFCNLL
jgi:hypothetical protein